ncbi:MAG: primosomal protein N' [Spirochaetaceae bacterium 4572_59]|nr:MAG: primosomal protein N' [Spirochaetaceae bacterium 4572_59]
MEPEKKPENSQYINVVFNLPLNSVFTYALPEKGNYEGLDLTGRRVSAPFGRRDLTGWIIGHRDSLPEAVKEGKAVHRIVDDQPLFKKDMLELARWISNYYLCSLGEALAVMLPGGRKEKDLPPLGLGGDKNVGGRSEIVLSDEQAAALKEIRKREKDFYYLHGITGSGKTEVFLHLAEDVLVKGQSVLYLVPEISLTHQLVDSLSSRFQTPIAVLHSHLTPSQRLKEWRRIQSGEARLVIGARSAIFAPLEKLGLIILDEEHENSYKSGSSPRYHGRQVAMKRCRREGAVLLMGSATPSVEAWHLMEKGTICSLKLTSRPTGGSLPSISIVDMKNSKSLLSQELIQSMDQVLKKKKQIILFLNRRGHSYFFHCKSCGYEMKCRQCSVSLTYHKNRKRMICHYCGYQEKPVTVCPDCGSVDVGYAGFGTEHVEEQVRQIFLEARIARLDMDAAKKKGVLQETISNFRKGEIDILLGTQMVAKGLNFPGVSLVGIVLADTGLSLPDFRAGERTFSLIVQVAGRAGRYSDDGEVLIQTFRPENPAIALAASGEWEDFYHYERDAREVLGFPPFSRLIRIVHRGKNVNKPLESLELLTHRFRQVGIEDVMGPAECPLGVIAGNYRYNTLVRSRNFSEEHHLIQRVLEDTAVPSGVYREIDVDPVQLL